MNDTEVLVSILSPPLFTGAQRMALKLPGDLREVQTKRPQTRFELFFQRQEANHQPSLP
jgi:hypothetical protein